MTATNPKPKFARTDVMKVAGQIVGILEPFVSRLEIAGSIRRGKERVSDIELLFVPKLLDVADGLFDSKTVDLADQCIEKLFSSGLLGKRLNSAGHVAAWGPKNKLAVHTVSGIPIDFFSTTEENFWVSLVIRTGSLETNLRLTKGAQRLGRSLEAYGSGVKCNGGYIHARTEREVFEICGVPYLEVWQR